jgi:hypothetical protein
VTTAFQRASAPVVDSSLHSYYPSSLVVHGHRSDASGVNIGPQRELLRAFQRASSNDTRRTRELTC